VLSFLAWSEGKRSGKAKGTAKEGGVFLRQMERRMAMEEKQKAPTGEALIRKAYGLFEEFRAAYGGEWERLERMERVYRGEHWQDVPVDDPNEPRPMTPVIQSTVENISADLMDMMPQAVITPETAADEETARVVEALIRQNHDAASYEREYWRMVHDLLVGGYAVQEVGYDPAENGGLGGAFIRHVDNRGILFDPLCTDIQDGRAVFKFCARPRQWLQQHYPEKAQLMKDDAYSVSDVAQDGLIRPNRKDTLLVLEYWWREYDELLRRHRVHMAILCGGQVLSDSRDAKPQGYFAHGMYPFFVTPLFIRKGSPLGLGVVDMFENRQRFSDKLDQIMLKNALMASHNKLMVTEASGFDVEDLRDWSKEVHQGESLGGITWFSTPPLPAYIMQYIGAMRESIKEESGANDFSRGGTNGGVTAAAAIAALQEMSSKRARMASRQMHSSLRDAVRMEIEVEREFNIFDREVQIVVNGEKRNVRFSSELLSKKGVGGEVLPIEFAVSVKVQKENRWSMLGQNETVLEMLKLGVIAPDQAVELMYFDGKEQLLNRIAQGKKEQA